MPVSNENDTVAYEELRFGDNDTLGGLVCNLLEADLLVFVVDGREGLVPGDRTIARELRERGVPVLLAVNKADDRRAREGAAEFYQTQYELLKSRSVAERTVASHGRQPRAPAPASASVHAAWSGWRPTGPFAVRSC